MTREEAIKWLNKLYARADITDEYGDMEDMQPYEEAVNMAIKALEQKPKTIQEIQAESEKYEKAFEDGYEQGYAQARFDYEQEPCEDAISRQYLIEKATNWEKHFHDSERYVSLTDIQNAPSVKPQELKTEQFAKWVATEIFDDMWEYNYEAFAEIACRKLAKLGIVTRMGDEWVLVEQQESDEEE